MFDAELQGIGKVWETVFSQGSLFINTYVADASKPENYWFLLFFSAVVVYGIVETLIIRKRR